ncbi:response regulator transcription factor [Pseudogracilibacillus sp. SO30301A]|uniref:response regulator transcription factor n=1 Tax=Pseudogracilibacillus sp. SO30301A TaxID=3098291 RepID=UPI00300E6949
MKEPILVVEDDVMIRNLITIYLNKNGYDVLEAEDGERAKELFLKHHPCLIVLDLMLPKISGEVFCKWVRKDMNNNDVSIIMLSAKSQIGDKINGLQIGADNYITKPFNPDELVAHVEAMLRRTGMMCQKITYDGLCIMPRKREVLLYDKSIHLTKHEFELLYLLMSHPNTVFTRERLVNELYAYDEQDILDRTIDAHIKKLREKIEAVPSKPRRIRTIRGMGYKFVN